MQRILADLHFAARRARKHAGFTTIAVLSLALGIGANTAIFSLIDAVLLRRPPLPHREQIAEVYQHQPGFDFAPFSYPDYVDFREASTGVLSRISLAGFVSVPRDMGDHVETLFAEIVNGDYFPLLGLPPQLGRLLDRQDDLADGAHPLVVLSDNYWRRAFAADPAVIGREIRLSGRVYTIVGVAPRTYVGTFPGIAPALFAPLHMAKQLSPALSSMVTVRDNHSLFMKARLASGASMARLRTVAAAFTSEMQQRYRAQWSAQTSLVVVPATEIALNPLLDRVVLPAAATLMIVVALVLVVACANLASFLLAQARDRQREIAVRAALGASRMELVRQLVIEALVLSAIGGVAGVLVSRVTLAGLLGVRLPIPLPLYLDVTLDARVLAFAVAASLLAGLVFGLLPALQATRPNVSEVIKAENTGGPRRRVTLRGALVVGQLAVSLVVLLTAALFLRSLQARERIDPGFGHAPAAMVWFTIPTDRYAGGREDLLLDDVEARVRRIAGVQATGVIDNMLLNSTGSSEGKAVNVPGFVPPKGEPGFRIDFATVDAGFLDAAGVRLLRGRGVLPSDDDKAPRVAVINEEMAKQFWPGTDAVGRTFRADSTEYRIVGVSANTKVRSLGESPRPFFFGSARQERHGYLMLVARTRAGSDPEPVTAQIVRAMRGVEPDIAVMQATTMERHLAAMMLPAQLGALAFGLFAALALGLAVVGVYGVVNYAVTRRSREVGIRLALGAQPEAVVRLLMREGLTLVLTGAVIGVALGLATTRALQGLLSDVTAADPLAFIGAPFIFLAVGALASWLPARRSTNTDPVQVLRAE